MGRDLCSRVARPGAAAVVLWCAGLVAIGSPTPAQAAAGLPAAPCPVPVPVICGGSPPSPPPPQQAPLPAISSADSAPDYLEDPGRSGAAPDDAVAPPLLRVWTHKFSNNVSYPVIAGGRVFVGVDSTDSGSYANGARVFALGLRSGRTLWEAAIPGTYFTAMPAYDGGRLFVVNWNGTVRAFSASTGRSLWTAQPAGDSYSDPPVAAGGVVYLVSGGSDQLTAIDETSGQIRWTTRVTAEYGSSIAVDNDRVYVDSCEQLAAYSRASGALAWERPSGCSTSPFGVTLFGGVLAANDGSRLFSRASGQQLGSFPWSFAPPAVANGLLIVTSLNGQSAVEAVDPRTGAMRWRRASSSGYSDPLVVGRDVFVLHETKVQALDTASGRFRGQVPISPGRGSSGLGGPPDAFAAAEGYLVAPFESALSAYVGLFDPRPHGVGLRTDPFVTQFGSRPLHVDGRLGSALRTSGSVPIVLLRAQFAQRHFHLLARGRSFADGGFSFAVRPTRNTLYVVLPSRGRVRARPVEAFVYPRPRFHLVDDGATGLVRASVELRFDPAVHLAGREGYLYLDRVRQKRLVLLGGAPLAGPPGRARFQIEFPPVKHVGSHDTVLWCVHRLTSLGLGYPNVVDARCGSRTIRFR